MSSAPHHSAPTVCPPLEEDEFLLGYVWRLCLSNSRRSMKGMSRFVLERTAVQPPWLVPGNLSALFAAINPVGESADGLMKRNTVLPALLPFARGDSASAIVAHVYYGEHILGVASLVGLGGKDIVSKPVLSMCPRCIEEDEEALGVPIWRRQHQLPCLGVCAKHEELLWTGCGKCAMSQPNSRHPRLPGLKCWCGMPCRPAYPEPSDADMEVLLRMARLGRDLLEGAIAGFSTELVGAHYHLRAQQDGYENGTRVHSERLAEDLTSSYSGPLLRRLNASVRGGQNWVTRHMGAMLAPLGIGRNLVLLDYFGGLPCNVDLARAEEHIARVEAARARQRNLPTRTAYTVEMAVDAIRACLKERPEASRQDVLLSLGRLGSWLREVDPRVYEQVMPAQRRGEALARTTQMEALAQLDERASTWVRERREQLLAATTRPMPLSRRALLTGCPSANAVSTAKLTNMPLTRRALGECVETRTAFQDRLARWLLLHPDSHADLEGFHHIARSTGLTMSHVDQLNAEQSAESAELGIREDRDEEKSV